MKIISNFKDYYDVLSEFNKADYKTHVWKRETNVVEVDKDLLVELEGRSEGFNRGFSLSDVWYVPCYLIIAGKVYPFLETWRLKHFSGFSKWIRDNQTFVYVPEKMEKGKTQPYFKKHRSGYYGKTKFKNPEDIFFVEYPDMSQLCVDLDTPVILIRIDCAYEVKGLSFRNVIINPNLSDYNFKDVMKAPEVYQTIDTFMGNAMVKDKMPESVQTDIEKLEAHGFDKKISFRKPKVE